MAYWRFFIVIVPIIAQCFSASIPDVIDLSYTYDSNTPTVPLEDIMKFNMTALTDVEKKFGLWMEINDLATNEHTGTHIDAPRYLVKEATTVEDIDPEKLYRVHGVKIDIRDKIKDNVNYAITKGDIEEWIDQHGHLPDGVVVLFETGYGEKSNDSEAYSGKDETHKMNFPGLGKSAADFLVSYKENNKQTKGVYGVGLDVLSLDVGTSTTLPAHCVLLENDIYGLENVANIHLLPERGFYLTMSPMKIGGGSGGPTRIFAEVPRNSALSLKGCWTTCFCLLVLINAYF